MNTSGIPLVRNNTSISIKSLFYLRKLMTHKNSQSYKNSLIAELDVRMIVIWIPRILITFNTLVVVVASDHTSVLIKIISSSIRFYSRKKKPAGTTGSDWMSSNETVNYLSYSRHAGFVVSWKTHVTCSIRTEKMHTDCRHVVLGVKF